MPEFRATFSEAERFHATLTEGGGMNADFGQIQYIAVADYYDGETVITPGSSAVTLPTAGKTMTENITVNPIPSNYGLISWNGAVLTVS